MWLLERRKNPEFRDHPAGGPADGIWWSGVTLMTVGYGDKVPRSRTGRTLTLMWMLAGVLLLTLFTASVTSALTLEGIRQEVFGLDELYGKGVVTVSGTTAASFLEAESLPHDTMEDIDLAIAAVEDGDYDAVVFDAPVLAHYAAGEGKGTVGVVGVPLTEESYGIAYPRGSALRERVDRALLEISESGEYAEIYDRWFTPD